MKYSFCFTIKKVIKEDSVKEHSDNHMYIKNKDNNEVEILCGPWRDTETEAKKDEELYKKDKKAFKKLIKE
ncbi:MAG: hypothetical protein KKH98_08880 [Spirochaetes bacterium]|nr:hypothetical protein [Spirochaetota bacterium]